MKSINTKELEHLSNMFNALNELTAIYREQSIKNYLDFLDQEDNADNGQLLSIKVKARTIAEMATAVVANVELLETQGELITKGDNLYKEGLRLSGIVSTLENKLEISEEGGDIDEVEIVVKTAGCPASLLETNRITKENY